MFGVKKLEIKDSLVGRSRFELIALISYLAVLFCGIWYVNYCTPMMQDDYMYASYMSESGFKPGVFNENLMDVVQSCWNHYFLNNGRMANNLAFLFIRSKAVYNVFASLIHIVGLCLMCRLFLGKVTIYSFSICLLGCFIFLPVLLHSCCWCDGALNYAWGGSMMLIAAWLVYLSSGRYKKYLQILGVFLFVVSGSMHEMLGATLVGGGILWIIKLWYTKERISKLDVLVLCAIILGALIPLTSPAIHQRAGNVDYFTAKFVLMTSANMVRSALLPLIAFAILLLYHTRKRNFDFFYFYACVSFALAWLMGTHSFTGCAYFYFSFAVLLWLLKSTAGWISSRGNGIQWVVVLAALGVMTFSCAVFYRINERVSAAFQQGRCEKVVALDVKPVNLTESLAYVCGLPINMSYIYPYLGKYHKMQDFIVIQRTVKGQTATYDHLLSLPPDEIGVARTPDGWTYIRLSCNKTCDIFKGLELNGEKPCRVTVCPYMEFLHKEFFTILYDRCVARQFFLDGAMDYYGGYVFVLIPPTQEKYVTCKLILQSLMTQESEVCTIPLVNQQ